jgi:hypothetical protein
MALLPSGVKYRLYGCTTGTVPAGRAVRGSITVSELNPSLSTYRWVRSQDGVTWCGIGPTTSRSTTWKVAGSMISTVPLPLSGT